ncbi:MAG: sugar ABC transporter substrate-binding protein [Proteobacteria bacterium]|nr:sugar ABC transporter substrate-binding protein [Pseudomonadota bacterium]MDA0992046.1 sugar ABC transporter substrate-binding protein [Pseudomonadota bacterium]
MRHSKKFLSVVLCLLVVACGDSVESNRDVASSGDKSERPTVALIMKSLANEYFVTMAAGAREHQASHEDRYRLIVNGIKNEIDLAQQVALVDQMISAGADAIVIAPADSKALIPALARASAAGIVIINIDNRLDEDILKEYDLTVPFVGPDNFVGAEMVGQYLGAQLTAGQKVAILEGVPTAHNSQRRTAGFLKAMVDRGLDVVAQQSAQWDQTQAVTVTSGILVQHPDLAAILCANDNMALGAAAAVTQAGKSGQIKIIGIDNISAVRDLIKRKVILATLDQYAGLLAVNGIEYALDALKSGAVLADKITAVDLITADTIN